MRLCNTHLRCLFLIYQFRGCAEESKYLISHNIVLKMVLPAQAPQQARVVVMRRTRHKEAGRPESGNASTAAPSCIYSAPGVHKYIFTFTYLYIYISDMKYRSTHQLYIWVCRPVFHIRLYEVVSVNIHWNDYPGAIPIA